MAAIVSRASKQLICGATIISDYYAMTAAHCVNVPGRFPEQTALLVGDHDYDSGMLSVYSFLFEIFLFYFIATNDIIMVLYFNLVQCQCSLCYNKSRKK